MDSSYHLVLLCSLSLLIVVCIYTAIGAAEQCRGCFVTLDSYRGCELNVPNSRSSSHIQASDSVKLVKTFHRCLWTVDQALYKESACRLGDFISSQRALGVFA